MEAIVGRVAALYRYPVKSMGAQPLEAVEVSWHGLAGDRRWGFVRPDSARSGFPWLTLRQRNDLNDYRPHVVEPGRPDVSRTLVRTPSGRELDVLDPALAAELGEGVRGMKLDRGTFDSAPLSLITTRTVAGLGALLDEELDVRRFRPNLVVETQDGTPFPEDAWVGGTVRLGGLRMRVDRRDKRCVVVTVDPRTGRRNPDVLRAIVGERGACLGVYGSTVEPGRVAVGDPVSVSLPR